MRASTMSHSTASSEWTVTGPFTAAIIGTSMSSICMTRRMPSKIVRSQAMFLIAPRAMPVGASSVGQADEVVAGPGEHHHPVVTVRGDRREQLGQVAVRPGAPVEGVAAAAVHRDRQHALLVPGGRRRLEAILVLVQLHAVFPLA